MTEQSKLYMIITNKNNDKCIFLTPAKPFKTSPLNPEILYDGNEHAILYRNEKDCIILDYLPQKEQPLLKRLKQILIVEYDTTSKKISHEYYANITISKKLPEIKLQLKK